MRHHCASAVPPRRAKRSSSGTTHCVGSSRCATSCSSAPSDLGFLLHRLLCTSCPSHVLVSIGAITNHLRWFQFARSRSSTCIRSALCSAATFCSTCLAALIVSFTCGGKKCGFARSPPPQASDSSRLTTFITSSTDAVCTGSLWASSSLCDLSRRRPCPSPSAPREGLRLRPASSLPVSIDRLFRLPDVLFGTLPLCPAHVSLVSGPHRDAHRQACPAPCLILRAIALFFQRPDDANWDRSLAFWDHRLHSLARLASVPLGLVAEWSEPRLPHRALLVAEVIGASPALVRSLLCLRTFAWLRAPEPTLTTKVLRGSLLLLRKASHTSRTSMTSWN